MFEIHVIFVSSGLVLRYKNLRLGGGVCVPATCSTTKIQSYVGDIIAAAELTLTNDYDQSVFCRTSDPKPLETIDIVAM